VSGGETHYRARRVPGGLADPEASRCGLPGKVTDWPAKVTCQRCRVLGEADDPPPDRARWHTDGKQARAVSINPDELLARMLTEAQARDGDPLAGDLLVFHRLMTDRMPWPTAWEERRVEDVPASGPELAADGTQRRYHQRMLTDAGPACRRDGQPWPCEVTQVLDAMDAADAHARTVLDAAPDLDEALALAIRRVHVSGQEVWGCPYCHCGCGRPHAYGNGTGVVEHYAANGTLCDTHAGRLAAEARFTELRAVLEAWPPAHPAAAGG
jgi:hypothetical protein